MTKKPKTWVPTAPNSLVPRLGLQIDGVKPLRSQKIEEAVQQNRQVEAAVTAGQLAVGQYATPHTRQAAGVAARTIQEVIADRAVPMPEMFVEGVVEVALLNARDALGQYYQPHTRQAAETAAHSILIQNGYLEQGEQ